MTTYRAPAITGSPATDDAVEWNGSIWVPRSFKERAAKALTTKGDILYADTTGTTTRLPVGSTDDVLTVAAGKPSWAAAASTTPRESMGEQNPSTWLNSMFSGTWTVYDFKNSSDLSTWTALNTPSLTIDTSGQGRAYRNGDNHGASNGSQRLYVKSLGSYYKTIWIKANFSRMTWSNGGDWMIQVVLMNSASATASKAFIWKLTYGNSYTTPGLHLDLYNNLNSWNSNPWAGGVAPTGEVYLGIKNWYSTLTVYVSFDGQSFMQSPTYAKPSGWWGQLYYGFGWNCYLHDTSWKLGVDFDWVAYN